MGKVGRWLRSFLTGKKVKDKGDADGRPSPSTGHASTPAAKEKRRWSFRRPAAAASVKDTSTSGQGQLASTSSHCFSEVHVVAVEDQHVVAPATVVPAASKGSAGGDAEEEGAAVRIQSAFRAYLARKALCALRGMVKLQAMVRGQLVRRQADMTLRRIQALVAAQRLARAERLRLLEDGKTAARTPRPRSSRRSPQHHDNVRIVEVDDGGGARRSSSCSTPARAEPYQKASPTASGMTSDGSARTLSGRFEEHSASFSAASESSGRRRHRHRGAADHHAAAALLFPRNYMANTESSRAKARSQSAPRHRPASARGSDAASALPSPSPSCERPPSGSGARRRASLDRRDLAAAPSPRSSDAGRVERCASQARAGAACPAGSECGSSSSTLMTSAAAARIA